MTGLRLVNPATLAKNLVNKNLTREANGIKYPTPLRANRPPETSKDSASGAIQEESGHPTGSTAVSMSGPTSAAEMDDRTTSCESRDAGKNPRQIKLDESSERD
jgi:hypothetical protein